MTADGESVAGRVVGLLAAAYRRQGFHALALPAVALTGIAPAEELEPALAQLFDHGHLVAVGRNGVALHPSARTGILSATVLAGWNGAIAAEPEGPVRSLHVDNMTAELGTLVRWALAEEPPPDLTQRAAELAGVLVTAGLDPGAMELVRIHGGTPRSRLEALAASPARSCPDLGALVALLRRDVSTVRPTG